MRDALEAILTGSDIHRGDTHGAIHMERCSWEMLLEGVVCTESNMNPNPTTLLSKGFASTGSQWRCTSGSELLALSDEFGRLQIKLQFLVVFSTIFMANCRMRFSRREQFGRWHRSADASSSRRLLEDDEIAEGRTVKRLPSIKDALG